MGIKQLRTRLRIWYLQVLVRIVQSRWFQWLVLRPVTYIVLYWFAWALVFGRLPKSVTEADPMLAEARAKLEALLQQRAKPGLTDWERGIGQTITWGTAGVGVFMLTTIVTTHVLSGTAIFIAIACFALSIPLLVVLGLADLSQTDSTNMPLTVRETINLHSLIGVAHLVFYLGFAALLWGYDFRISIVFVLGCYVAWKYFGKFASKRVPLQPTTTVASDAKPISGDCMKSQTIYFIDPPLTVDEAVNLERLLPGHRVSYTDKEILLSKELKTLLLEKGETAIVSKQLLTEEVLPNGVPRNAVLDSLKYKLTLCGPSLSLLIVDPYLFAGQTDPTFQNDFIYVFGDAIRKCSTLDVCTEGHGNNEKAFDAAIAGLNPSLKVTKKFSKAIHDRFWIADGARGLFVGTSFNGIGKRYAVVDYLTEDDARDIAQRYQQLP